MRRKLYLSVLRTPLLLILGGAWLTQSESAPSLWSLGQNLAYPFHRYFCAPPFQHNCFLFLPATLLTVPNTFRFLGTLLTLLLLLEARPALFSAWKRGAPGEGFLTGGSLCLAVVPWFLLDIQGPTVRLLPLLALYSLILWLFLLANLELPSFRKYGREHPWTSRLAEWTFPVSDLFLYKFHQSRLKARAGWLRFVPVLFYAALLGSLLARELTVYQQSPRAVRIPALTYNPQDTEFDGEEIWYSETVGAHAGLWRYDPTTRKAMPWLRAQDSRTFCMGQGFVYLYDGFEGVVQKAGKENRQIQWATPVPREQGPFELVLHDERLFVLGAQGYLVVLGKDGQKSKERFFPVPIRHLTPLGAGQIAFVSKSPLAVYIANDRLQVQRMCLLPSAGISSFGPAPEGIPFLAGTEYDPRLHTLLIGTLWGEILRYDLEHKQWLPSWRTSPGLGSTAADEANRLLFAYNRARGTVDILDMDSGRRLQRILASVFGNALRAFPAQHSAVLSVRGPDSLSAPRPGGLYRLDYAAHSARPFRFSRRETP